MKIGFFVDTPTSSEKKMCGSHISLYNLLIELIQLNVTPYVVASEEWDFTERVSRLGISTLIVPFYEEFIYLYDRITSYTPSNQLQIVEAIEKISNYFLKNDVELIHINSLLCGLIGAKVARNINIPYIIHIREFLRDDFGVEYKDKIVSDELIKKADCLIAISKSVQNYLLDRYPSAKVKLIYNGVNYNDYSRPNHVKLKNKVTKIAIIGRVTPAKKQLDAVKAVERVIEQIKDKRIVLEIVGFNVYELTGYESEIINYVNDHNLRDNIHLFSYKEKEEIFDLLADCDIGLICSKKEAFGRVTVEYMLSHLFVIGSDSGGTHELISNGFSGLLYKEGSIEELSNAIIWAITHPKQANEMIVHGHEDAASRFISTNNTNSIYKLYRSILYQ